MKSGSILSYFKILLITFPFAKVNAQVALPDAINVGSKVNYTRVFDVLIPEKNANAVVAISDGVKNLRKVTTYQDGLGRTFQTSVRNGAYSVEPGQGPDPVSTDLVSIKRFDFDQSFQGDFKSYIYLPFSTVKTLNSPISDGLNNIAFIKQAEFWLAKQSSESHYYNETRSERSPLGRTNKSLNVGDGFVGANVGVSMQYEFNNANEIVWMWNIGFAPGSVPAYVQAYPASTLNKSIMLDEKGKKVYTYTDFEGRTILKKVQDKEPGAGLDENGHDGWLCTYYVYDDLGQLRSIISPKAFKYLQTTGLFFNSNDVYQELCFWYEYDEIGRTIVKNSPGAGQIQMVYDNKDRLVLSQDENQRNRSIKQWSFYLYDELDRSIATGLFDNNASRDAMAAFVKNLNNGNSTITIYTGSNEALIADNPVAGTSGYCNSCTNTVINTVSYYDNYNYQGAKAFNTNFNFAPPETNPANPNINLYIETPVTSSRVIDLSTGMKTRVIDNNYDDGNPANDIFLTSTVYYDEKGRLIQDLSDNIKGAVDYVTNQYDFSGQVISVCEKHTMPGTSLNDFAIISKYDFDWIRRVTGVSKKIGNENYKKIVSYTYDALGQVETKKLSPDYNAGAGIETLKFDYTIQGWLNGINKDYSLSTSSLDQWGHYFGMHMGYDNRDNKFVAAQYNGNITGAIWKTQGDNMPRRYDYEYDNVNRFTKASFVQKETPSDPNWVNNKMDFSVTNISYDENGNLMQMYQKGIIPGNATPLFIDKLTYEYKQVAGSQWSNQLKKVFDQPDLSAANNGALDDFKDETFGTNADDYVFDGNGNLVRDNNKKIRNGSGSGVEYNFLDKPQKVTIENKSITEFIYDATGAKLGKKITNTVTSTSKTTWYMGDFIYEEVNSQVNLQMILHEEGRIRVSTPIVNPRLTIGGNFDLPDGKKGVFDFFIKDNLQNTRAIVTEETHTEFNNCAMEVADAYYEERMFGQVDVNGNPVAGNNEVILTRENKSVYSSGWLANPSAKVSRLGRFGQTVGPNMILKVMAGDNIAAKTDYYYNDPVDNSGTNNILPNILTSLLSSLSYNIVSTNLHGAATNIYNGINSSPGDFGTFLNNQNTGTNATPQAYMNILFFDENFNFIPYDNVTGLGSYAWRVSNGGDAQDIPMKISKAPKNGYAYVYLSNESKTYVHFDNFEVTHVRGHLIEENAYYAFGLKITGISAIAFGASDNAYGYQGDYSELDDETEWNDFELRNYDAQIGRFIQNDPYDQFSSPYLGIANDPINNIDEDGGFTGWAGALIGGIVGGGTAALIASNNGVRGWGLIGATIGGALLGAGIGYGIDMSLIQNNVSTLRFGTHFREFYDGIFTGGDHWVYGLSGEQHSLSPEIWKGLNINLEMGWVDGTGIVKDIFIQYASSAGALQPGDQLMTTTVGPPTSIRPGAQGVTGQSLMGGNYNTVVDNATVPLINPTNDIPNATYRTTVTGGTGTIDGGMAEHNGGTVRNNFAPSRRNVNATSVTITAQQVTGSVQYQKNDQPGSRYSQRIKRDENRFTIRTVRKARMEMKRFKIFGLKIPFLRKKN